MKNQVLHTVWCNISGVNEGELWDWSLLGVKGLILREPPLACPSVLQGTACPQALRFVFSQSMQHARKNWGESVTPPPTPHVSFWPAPVPPHAAKSKGEPAGYPKEILFCRLPFLLGMAGLRNVFHILFSPQSLASSSNKRNRTCASRGCTTRGKPTEKATIECEPTNHTSGFQFPFESAFITKLVPRAFSVWWRGGKPNPRRPWERDCVYDAKLKKFKRCVHSPHLFKLRPGPNSVLHMPSRMQISKTHCFPSYPFDSGHVKYGVWPMPKKYLTLSRLLCSCTRIKPPPLHLAY